MNTTRHSAPGTATEPPAKSARGSLYLIPAPLDFGCQEQGSLQDVLPLGTLQTASRLRVWVCENAKSLRAYLKRIDAVQPLGVALQAIEIKELPHLVHKKGDHLGSFDARPLLSPALAGHDIGLASEAGLPAVADPGSSVVRAAHALDIAVVTLVGPSSLLLALAGSGLNGQSFAFVGYLPQESAARMSRLRVLESIAVKDGQTQLFIETPYRNAALMQALLQTLAPSTRLAVGSGLSMPGAHSRCMTVAQWRQHAWMPDNDTPAVFAIGR